MHSRVEGLVIERVGLRPIGEVLASVTARQLLAGRLPAPAANPRYPAMRAAGAILRIAAPSHLP
jgi:hypothetical protein